MFFEGVKTDNRVKMCVLCTINFVSGCETSCFSYFESQKTQDFHDLENKI